MNEGLVSLKYILEHIENHPGVRTIMNLVEPEVCLPRRGTRLFSVPRKRKSHQLTGCEYSFHSLRSQGDHFFPVPIVAKLFRNLPGGATQLTCRRSRPKDQ
uniref:Uncharacterized protein ORF100_3 n=1 Tax=Nothoceros aenigmaticus TaxID=13813 RepID=C3RYN4_9EMBR|nr:hypothetical protein MeaeMp28 [Nothoceros aenigmaticus]ACC86790.1 hypothetical protein MeaeMp28 [Nothoceros aenigmaticus]